MEKLDCIIFCLKPNENLRFWEVEEAKLDCIAFLLESLRNPMVFGGRRVDKVDCIDLLLENL